MHRRSRIPTKPRQVQRQLVEIIEWAEKLIPAYESDYDVGYAVRGRSIQATDPDWRPTSDTSDPTGEAVTELEYLRTAVARIAERVGEAHASLDEACAAIIQPIPSGRRCWRCRRPIRRPRGRSSGLCDTCDRTSRRESATNLRHLKYGNG
jgi:hypothetical protein